MENKFCVAAIVEPDGSGVTVMGRKFVPESKENKFGHECEEWCHCRACGGFKMGGVPHGPSCSCPDEATCPHSPPGMDPPADPKKCADCSSQEDRKDG